MHVLFVSKSDGIRCMKYQCSLSVFFVLQFRAAFIFPIFRHFVSTTVRNITLHPSGHVEGGDVPQGDLGYLQFVCVMALILLVTLLVVIKETIGSGGFAKVKVAKHKITGEKVRSDQISIKSAPL